MATLVGVVIAESSAGAKQGLQPFLVTGNGHGFQTYDLRIGKIKAFYEAPFRFLRPNARLDQQGVRRRNLVFDFYFGVDSTWLGNDAGPAADVSYVDDSNIILSKQNAGGANVETYYWAPFGYEGNVMIALLKAPAAARAYAIFNFKMGDRPTDGDRPQANGETLRYVSQSDALVEAGPGGGAMIYLPLTTVSHKDCTNVFAKIGTDLQDKTDCSGTDVVPGFQGAPSAASGWMGVAIAFSADASKADSVASAFRTWQNQRGPQQLLDDATQEWASWRKPIPNGLNLSNAETHLWRQSETVLRMAQVRVPNGPGQKSFGMILASLPNLTSWGGALDWMDWSTGWVRDGTYAIVALARSGHVEEARLGLEFILNAEPVGVTADYFKAFDLQLYNNDLKGYRVSVTKYFGTGQEESDWGSPGNGRELAEYNVQLDGWGLFLWAAREYVSASGDPNWLAKPAFGGKSIYNTLLEDIASKLEKCVDKGRNVIIQDASIWEDHNTYRAHFLYTTAAAARGFCDMALLSSIKGDLGNGQRFDGLHNNLKKGIANFQKNDNALATTLESLDKPYYADGSAVEAINWGLVDPKGGVATATLSMIDTKLKVVSGGYRRRDAFPGMYDNNEWILLDFRIADASFRAGNVNKGNGILKPVIDNAAINYNLLPELYNAQVSDGEIGAYTGSRPMVGYGAGAFVMSMLTRAGQNNAPPVCYIPPSEAGVRDSGCQVWQTCPTDGTYHPPEGGGGGGGEGGGPGAVYGPSLCSQTGSNAGPLVWAIVVLVCAMALLGRLRRS